MPLSDYTIRAENWKHGQKSDTVEANKGAKKYQIKWYKNPPYPFEEDVTRGRAKKNAERCQALLKERIRLNDDLREADRGEGQIAYAEEVFLNLNNDQPGVIEAVAFVVGTVSYDSVRGDPESRYSAMVSAARAISKIHAKQVVHGDLKPENVLLVREGGAGGQIRAVLIDFDSSYYEDSVPSPEEISGTEGYIAPEVNAYMNDEEYEEPDGSDSRFYSALSRARDIYALGALFHMMITGSLPRFDGSGVVIDRRRVRDAYMQELIRVMLIANPFERPDIDDVVEMLESKSATVSSEPYEALWPEHAAEYEYKSEISRVKKIRRLDDYGSHRYRMHYGGGQMRDFSLQMMINVGIVKKKVAGNEAQTGKFVRDGRTYEADLLWPEHDAYRIDREAMRKRGYIGFYRVSAGGAPEGYAVFKRGSGYLHRSFTVLSFEKCVVMKV